MALCISLHKDAKIVLLLFQNEASISGLDGCNEVWDHSIQTKI